ncbi:MAG: cytidylate kinase [Tenericutes bacterium GWC2_39_45]|nr:MAG: cytidylate kinase [Tenericutes bacterium GWA2_38_26]OHE31252.1 MAG: cytidylate kinase [Tenericutes bacterium GWC2_39_45]OHE32788.1 MAG: cytidylate kinase [Tenericutes bacterium GWD2_38_27]OHE46419.1 MAG: cytidylate kinase [Tenericutes bacterium GWF2_38_8]HBG32737.1 (d)CMP kinase [Acholeplasmataceae bacterium]
MPGYKLAIDGPAGSGKSTISSLIAKKLGWTHIDTGAMYRAVTLQALELGINLNEEAQYRFLETSTIHYDFDRIYINDRDVTEAIRSEAVTNNVSLVSSFPYVRKKLVELQKQAAQHGNIIMDGRDIGTVVIPNADLKIFLTANVEERAKRRYKEHIKKGKESQISKVIEDIVIRDQKDSTRKESPLRKADDAIVLDTTYLTIEEVVNKIIELTDKKEN